MKYFKDDKYNHLAMKLRIFAEERAILERMPYWKILRNKVIVRLCTEQPKSLEEFKTKKIYLGKKWVEKYGEEIIAIIRDHFEDNEKEKCIDPNGVITMKKNGVFYHIAGNDALIFHRYFGYKVFGENPVRTGIPAEKIEKVMEKLDRMSMSYDVLDQEGELISSVRFANNQYEIMPE